KPRASTATWRFPRSRLWKMMSSGASICTWARRGQAEDARVRNEQQAAFDGEVLDGRPADHQILHERRVAGAGDAGGGAPLPHVRVVELDEKADRLERGAGRLETRAAEEEVAVERPIDGLLEGAFVPDLEQDVDVQVD